MKPTTARPTGPVPADRAAVVFLRPSGYGGAVRFRLFDDKKRFLGDSLPGIHWEVSMEPGEHWFYANGENAGILHALLAPGTRYYVVVRPYIGVWSARVELTALTPQSEDWPKLGTWLAETKPMTFDPRGQAELNKRTAEVETIMRQGAEVWTKADEGWRAEHSLQPHDGQTTAQPAPAATAGGYAAPPTTAQPTQPTPPSTAQPAPPTTAQPAQPTPPSTAQPAAPSTAQPTPPPTAQPTQPATAQPAPTQPATAPAVPAPAAAPAQPAPAPAPAQPPPPPGPAQ